MAATTLYLRNTQTGGGTGGTVYDLSTTRGTNATLSSTVSSNTFAGVFRFQFTLGADVPATDIPFSVSINAISAQSEVRWRIQELDSSNAVVASSSYATAQTTTGTKTGTISFSNTWVAGDRIAISVEYRRTGGTGTRTLTLNVNNANSYVQPDLAPITQTLSQSARFDNAATFYGPTVAAGAVSLLPGLFSNTNAFYTHGFFTNFVKQTQDWGLITGTPDVYQEWGLITEAADKTFDLGDLTTALELYPGLYANSNAFYAATLSARITLTPALFSNANTFYAANLSSTRQLFPALYSNANTFYAATLTARYSLTPGLYTNTSTIYAPAVAAKNTLTPARVDNANAFYGPSVAATYALAPGLFSDGDTFYAASVQSSYSLQPGRVDNASLFYGPTVSRGAIELLPGLLSNINVFYSPVVSTGGAIILVPLVENENSFYDAEISVSGGGDMDLPHISRLFSTGQLMNRI